MNWDTNQGTLEPDDGQGLKKMGRSDRTMTTEAPVSATSWSEDPSPATVWPRTRLTSSRRFVAKALTAQ